MLLSLIHKISIEDETFLKLKVEDAFFNRMTEMPSLIQAGQRKEIHMQFELTASMMFANYGNLAQEVKALEEGGIDSFHIDIMDGRYVPNFAMSLNDMRYIAGAAPT